MRINSVSRNSVAFYLKFLGMRFGPEFSRVLFTKSSHEAGVLYLDRYIFYFLFGTLRLHKFWRGDDDRAPHDHPWWFITFPFVSYKERYWDSFRWRFDGETEWRVEWFEQTRIVKAWRFHFRPAKFRHMVVGRADGLSKPFWTFVVSGGLSNRWGFWPKPDQFKTPTEWYSQ